MVMDKRSQLDLLSDLPLSIIHSILALVPIRDAVKTSVLSRQWRYKWITLPHLVFDNECASDKTSLSHFITQALFLHKGLVQKFKLSTYESFCIDQWLLFLSRNDVSTLILNDEESEDYIQIHSSLYSCENLTHLELWNCEVPPPPPTFNGFLCLRSLVLEIVEVSCKTIESIVANSPLLEEVTLRKYESSELRIHAPNLKYFNVKGTYKEILLYAPLLSKLSAIFAHKNINFLGGFPALEEFRGDIFSIKHFSVGVESGHCFFLFHLLRVLELSSVNFRNIKEIWVVIHLIMGAPNLCKLKIESRDQSKFASEVAPKSLWDSEEAPEFTFERLKVIEMRYAFGGLHEMKFIKFLLENSPVLKTLIYNPSSFIKDDKLLTLMANLMRYRRASANAEILFSKK